MRIFWTTAELLARGRTERDIRRAALDGAIRPVRRGLWTLPDAPEPLVRAARVGGLATSVTAARHLGLWTPPDPVDPEAADRERLHVAVRRGSTHPHHPDEAGAALRGSAGVVLHPCDADVAAIGAATGLAPVLVLLEHGFRSLPSERALAMLDSALHHRFISRRDLPALAARLPARFRAVVLAADGRADSGLETIVRHLLRLAGLGVVVHPVLTGIGEVDLLVEGRLIVECDGREFHDDVTAFARDRRRDLAAAATRYRVLRFTWQQVLFEWPAVEAAVFAALAA